MISYACNIKLCDKKKTPHFAAVNRFKLIYSYMKFVTYSVKDLLRYLYHIISNEPSKLHKHVASSKAPKSRSTTSSGSEVPLLICHKSISLCSRSRADAQTHSWHTASKATTTWVEGIKTSLGITVELVVKTLIEIRHWKESGEQVYIYAVEEGAP